MIYLVRHGRTTYNNEGRLQGGLDSPLTALGVEQATANGRLLKRLLGSVEAWRIQASPLGRTVRTAELLCAELGAGAAFETDPRLAEVRFGDWEGRAIADIEAASPEAITNRYELLFRAPGGETYEAFSARLGDWLAEAQADAKPRIAISHGVAGRVLRGLYLGLEPAEALRQEAPQDAVFRLADGRVEKIAAG